MNEARQTDTASVAHPRVLTYKLKRKLYARAIRSARNVGLGILKSRYAHQPVPLRSVQRLRRILGVSGEEHPLALAAREVVSAGETLRNPTLASIFQSREIGGYSLTSDVLDYLEGYINRYRPSLILEFGSGISTVCFAHYMREIYGGDRKHHVVSLEQDHEYAQATRDMLANNGLAPYAVVVHAPLAAKHLAGIDTHCYELPTDFPSSSLDSRRPDLVIIDGPSGGGSTRFGTIPLVRDWLAPSTRFFLDDALRDWELSVANAWSKLDGIQIDGIRMIGKGLLVGTIL